MGLILTLNKIIRYLIGSNFLMRARTATRRKGLNPLSESPEGGEDLTPSPRVPREERT